MQKHLSRIDDKNKNQHCATRVLRIIVPTLPSRVACLTDRKSRAARHATEFALWQASGGDFLHSSFAAEFIRVAAAL